MLALPTCHMIASAVLLDSRLASGALLSVCRNPVGRFRVVFTFLEPLLHQRTWGWLMIIQRASKAKVMTAIAMDRGYDFLQIARLNFAFDSELAVRGWTPLQIFQIVDVGSSKQFMVPRYVLASNLKLNL